MTLSTRPAESFIGKVEEWDRAEAALKKSLDASGQVWAVNEGDGAFYGPKIDIILKDSDGKEHQTATIQLDFQLPKRFELEYQSPAPELEKKGETTTDPELLATSGPVTPVLIHRAVLGSVERLMALLIEHYNGKYPFWLNPRQIIILTVNNDPTLLEYARSVANFLKHDAPLASIEVPDKNSKGAKIATPDGLPWAVPSHLDFAIELDESPRSVKKKISEAKRKRYSVIMVVGSNNVAEQSVSVDLSGLPDPHGWIAGAAYNLSEAGSVKITRAAKREEASKEKLADGEHPRYTLKQLKVITFNWRYLHQLLAAMETRYI